jgi:Ca2+/Na+ antiporter
MSPAAIILIVVVAAFVWSLLTIQKQASLATSLVKLFIGTIVLCFMLIEWQESMLIISCTGMSVLILLFGLADLIVTKLKANTTETSEQENA